MIKKSVLLLVKCFGIPFFIITLFFSCQSSTVIKDKPIHDFDYAPLVGIVYDSQNRPCQGVEVSYIKDSGKIRNSVLSDVNGRFVLVDIPKGSNTIRLVKENYETLEQSFGFYDATSIFYAQVTSLVALAGMAEEALDQRSLDKAKEYLNRMEVINAESPDYLFLSAVYYAMSGDEEKKESFWERFDSNIISYNY